MKQLEDRFRVNLFPNTKPTKNIRQQIIGCNIPCNLSQMMQSPADVQCQEIIGYLSGDPLQDVFQSLPGFEQAFIMAEVGYHGVAGFKGIQMDNFQNFCRRFSRFSLLRADR